MFYIHPKKLAVKNLALKQSLCFRTKRFWILPLLLCFITSVQSQDLLPFLDNCKDCKGKVKRIKTKQKGDINDYQSPVFRKTAEYNIKEQLIKTELTIDGRLSKTVFFHYIDSLLIYEQHVRPEREDYFLVYQYYKKKLPRRIIKVDKGRRIINYAELEYTPDYVPIYLKFYNVLGDLLEKRSVEYQSKNQVVIRTFFPKSQFSNLQKYELLCRFNQPNKLKKRDFRDLITRPINLEVDSDMVRVVKAVQTENREKVQIKEVAYDNQGNWINIKTYELKRNKNKRRLIKEITREIEYF